MSDYGFVYVMQNDAMDGIYKIGVTSRPVFKRAEELSIGTGVPAPYSPAYYLETSEARILEKRVHEALASYRTNPFREFFRCPLKMVIEEIRAQCEDALAEYVSDMAEEAMRPGSIDRHNPLWFEKSLYHPEAFGEADEIKAPKITMKGLFVLDVSEVE